MARLVSTPKDVVHVFGSSSAFSFSFGCWGSWIFPAVPFHLFSVEIILLPFDALRENLDTYDNNNFRAECKSGA